MKSREEYQASIFAKRDALLAKRKKRITQTITVTCAAILLTASVAAIPSFIEKPTLSNEPTEHTTISEVYEGYITQLNTDYDSLNEESESVKYQAEAMTEKAEFAAEAVPEGTTERLTNVVRYPVSKKHSYFPHTETESIGAVDNAVSTPPANDGIRPESQNEMYFETNRSVEEIAKAAFGYLTEGQKAECINADSPEIINVTSSTEKRYIVSFKTDSEKTYQVQIRHPNLELIEIGISPAKETVNEPSTHKPGYKGGTQ